MTNIITPSTLVEELVERTRLSWLQIAVIVGLTLILLAAGAAYRDGVLTDPSNILQASQRVLGWNASGADLWRYLMLYPAISVYLLLTQPILKRLRDGAIKSFRPLVQMDDDGFHRLLARASLFNRRREWLALGVGAVGGIVLGRPWEYLPLSLTLYAVLSGALGLGLTGWFIYSSLAGTRLFNELQCQPLDINIFDLKPVEPIGRWSLGIALAFIAGTTLSLLLAPTFRIRLETIIIYGALILSPVLVFFLNMMNTRQAMVAAKKRKLDMVRDNLTAASQALEERAAEGQAGDLESLLNAVAAWVAYEERVKKVPEWPYTNEIRRNLVLSMLLSFAVFLVQGVLFELFLRLLSLSG